MRVLPHFQFVEILYGATPALGYRYFESRMGIRDPLIGKGRMMSATL
jgi:hypothetical protein